MQLDPEQFADTVVAAIATATAPLLARIASLEQRVSSVKSGQDGVPGRDGVSADPAILLDLQTRCAAIETRAAVLPTATEILAAVGSIVTAEIAKQPAPDLAPVIAAEVQRVVAALPTPKDGERGEPGAPGASVNPEHVAALVKAAVTAAVAALPTPKDGERGERGEVGEAGASVDPAAVDVMVRAAVADAVERIPKPRDGHSPTADQVRPLVVEEVQKAVAVLPVPKDGERGDAGEPGASVDPADVDAMVSAHVSKAIAALPSPPAGERGERGERGESAEPVDPADIDAMVTKAVAALPRPENGHDGRSVTVDDVAPLIANEVQKAVYALPEPQDGVGVVGALIDRSGHLVVTLSDGTVKDVGPVVGQDGSPGLAGRDGSDGIRGVDGKDGLGFDDMVVEQDGDRGVVVKLIQGERVKTFGPFVFPVLVYKGVWVAGQTYERGQTVTWGGSMWHANKETTAKPGDGSSDWTLSVKKGSDGKEGKAITGPPGPRGEPGPIGPARY